MMMKVCILSMAVLLISYGLSTAIDLPESKLELEIQSLKAGGTDYVNLYASEDEEFDEFATEFDDGGIYEYNYKSPKKAFLYSFLIPGWGQVYSGSSIWKPLAMLGIEVGSWVGYFVYHNDGNKLTDEFEAFADAHWIEGERGTATFDSTYWGWIALFAGTDDSIPQNEKLPETRTQQYYEMIGKYDQFAGGWDDFWTENGDGPYSLDSAILETPRRKFYNDLRGRANDKLSKANNFIIVSMANHLLSAFDAALAANRYNNKSTEESWLSVRAEMKKYSATEEIPIVRFTYHFK